MIAGACRDHERLRFDYRAHSGAASRRSVEPYRLVNDRRRWYLVAWDTDRDAWRTFRADRIEPRTPAGPRFTPRALPPDREIAAQVARGVGEATWRYRARVIVHAPAAYVRGRLPIPVEVESLGEDRCAFEPGSDHPEMLALYLGMLDADFEIVDAPELVNALRKLTGRYQRAIDAVTTRPRRPDMARRRAAQTVDELLAEARAALPDRPSPAEALHAQASGALLIDIREDDQRRADGLIPGAIVLPRNSLEWRCDPASQWRHPAITRRDLRIILVCDQGYQSSLAAVNLQQLGLIRATDLDGGFTSWAAAGLPVIAPATPATNHRPATVIPGDQHSELLQPGVRDSTRTGDQRTQATRWSGAAVGDVRGAARGRRAGVILQARPLIEGPGHRAEEAAERPHVTRPPARAPPRRGGCAGCRRG